MERPFFIKIPDADLGEIAIGDLICFAEPRPPGEANFTRTEFARTLERYASSDQQRTVKYIEVNENTTDDILFDQTIRSREDLVIVDFQRFVEPNVLCQICDDLKAIAKQFRVRILAAVKIPKAEAGDFSIRDLPAEMQKSIDFLLLQTTRDSRRVISIAQRPRNHDAPFCF